MVGDKHRPQGTAGKATDLPEARSSPESILRPSGHTIHALDTRAVETQGSPQGRSWQGRGSPGAPQRSRRRPPRGPGPAPPAGRPRCRPCRVARPRLRRCAADAPAHDWGCSARKTWRSFATTTCEKDGLTEVTSQLAKEDQRTASTAVNMYCTGHAVKAMLSLRRHTSRMRMTVLTPLEVDRKGCVPNARDSSAPRDAASTAPACQRFLTKSSSSSTAQQTDDAQKTPEQLS